MHQDTIENYRKEHSTLPGGVQAAVKLAVSRGEQVIHAIDPGDGGAARL